MQISPMMNPNNTQPPTLDPMTQGHVPGQIDRLRTIKMRTNYTPDYYEEQGLQAPHAQIQDQPGAVAETQPLSPQYAALAKQRRALQVRERALMERETALSAQTGQSDQIAIARLKTEPLKVLLEAGVTYDQLTQEILNNPGSPELHALKRDMIAQEERVQKMLDDREADAERQTREQIKQDVISLVRESDQFELVKINRAIPVVMRLIEKEFNQTGKLMNVHNALSKVEQELFETAQRAAGLTKVRNQLQPQYPQMQRQQGMRTLTNRDTASVPLGRRARAFGAFNGTLKR
jgi:hypothetical protein